MAISNARIVGLHIDGGASVVHLLHPDAAGSTVATDTQDTAIHSALDLLSTTLGGRIVFPRGATLKIDAVTLDVPNVTFDAEHTAFSKSTASATHMFKCLDGTADNFEMRGGSIDMNATSFSSGATVSAFHFVRCYGLKWQGTSFSSGIEEGIKLYNCADVYLKDVEFDDFANNGVQFAVQSSSADGFTGSTTLKPPADFDGIYMDNVRCLNMDDGSAGEGQGISLGVASGTKTIKNVYTKDFYAKNCYRAWHTETNLSSQQIQNVVIDGFICEDPIRLAVSFVGVDRGSLDNFVITQSSSSAAASTSGDAEMVVVSGSSNTPSRDITIGRGTIQGGSSANTDYGIIVKQTCGFTYLGTALISDVATKVGSDSWNTVWDARLYDKDPICWVAQTSAQATTTATWTGILWGSDVRDPHSMNTTSTATSHKITPSWPGVWEATVRDSWTVGTSSGDRGLRIYQDDGVSAVLYGETIVRATTAATSLIASALIPIVQGASQFIRFERYQNAGADLTPSTEPRVSAYIKWVAGPT